MRIPLQDIKLHPQLQCRVLGYDWTTLDDYIHSLQKGEVFPPIDVFDVEGELFLVDGFHRYKSHEKVGVVDIEATLHTGSFEDALHFARYKANRKNGMRMSTEDKRSIVLSTLKDEKYSSLTTRELGALCGVSHAYIAKVKNRLEEEAKKDEKDIVTGLQLTLMKIHGLLQTVDLSDMNEAEKLLLHHIEKTLAKKKSRGEVPPPPEKPKRRFSSSLHERHRVPSIRIDV